MPFVPDTFFLPGSQMVRRVLERFADRTKAVVGVLTERHEHVLNHLQAG